MSAAVSGCWRKAFCYAPLLRAECSAVTSGNTRPSPFSGAGLLLVAAGCGIAGTISLGRNLTPFPKPSASSTLVRTGIYGLIRHPLYTAVFCGSVGWALVWQSWPALLAALALAPLFDAKARREERWLRQKFPEYAGYERQVRRFVPWIY